jgi:acetate kinase
MSSVLVVNPGSSSLRVSLVDTGGNLVEDTAHVEHPPESAEANDALDDFLGRIDTSALVAVGHRLVHGGAELRTPTVVDDGVVDAAWRVKSLAPLHVPATLRLLDLLREKVPNVPHVLCPDTAFHADLPEVAYTYPLPRQWREKFGLRRFGFHGLSYAWALGRTAELLGRPREDLSVVLAHLGGGSSVCAVRDGRSVDTSMGFTPLEGTPMAKRSGSIDPGLLVWLIREGGLAVSEVEDGLYRRSGLLGLSGGRSDDTRELVAVRDDDPAADLALRVFDHRVRREIAAAATNLDRVDALVFTGEIGWDQPEVREDICAGLGVLGISGGLTGNRENDGAISPPGARIPVLLVEPREDLQLCRDTMTALTS